MVAGAAGSPEYRAGGWMDAILRLVNATPRWRFDSRVRVQMRTGIGPARWTWPKYATWAPTANTRTTRLGLDSKPPVLGVSTALPTPLGTDCLDSLFQQSAVVQNSSEPSGGERAVAPTDTGLALERLCLPRYRPLDSVHHNM